MLVLKEKIKSIVEKNFQEIVEIRRDLHANPELSFQEFKTSQYIVAFLSKLDESKIERVGETGIVFTIQGEKSGKVIALRADIDALPIQEENDVSYKSKNEGVMHACGHDFHTASLLGAAKILTELKNELCGTVKLIFQHAEEKFPGGALDMIKYGVLENPKVDYVVGQHVDPSLESGKISFKKGKVFASSDEIYITIKGKGGHAANPYMLVDPIPLASNIILNLQQIVSRKANPSIPTILSFGKIIANGATNIIPDKVYIEGTFRTTDEEWRQQVHTYIDSIVVNAVTPFGAQCDIVINKGYPALENDSELTSKCILSAEQFLNKEDVTLGELFMGAEDFAYYAQKTPGCFYRLGTGIDILHNFGLHTSRFNPNENALKVGVGMLVWLGISLTR
jgi:amidohydrolase